MLTFFLLFYSPNLKIHSMKKFNSLKNKSGYLWLQKVVVLASVLMLGFMVGGVKGQITGSFTETITTYSVVSGMPTPSDHTGPVTLSPCSDYKFKYDVSINYAGNPTSPINTVTINLPLGLEFVNLVSSLPSGLTYTGSSAQSHMFGYTGGSQSLTFEVLIHISGVGLAGTLPQTMVSVTNSNSNVYPCSSNVLTIISIESSCPLLTNQENVNSIEFIHTGTGNDDLVLRLRNMGSGTISSINLKYSPDPDTELLEYEINSNSSGTTLSLYSYSFPTAPPSGGIDLTNLNLLAGADKYIHIKFKGQYINGASHNANGSYQFNINPCNCGILPITTSIVVYSHPAISFKVTTPTTGATFSNATIAPNPATLPADFTNASNSSPGTTTMYFKYMNISQTGGIPAESNKLTDIKVYLYETEQLGSINQSTIKLNGIDISSIAHFVMTTTLPIAPVRYDNGSPNLPNYSRCYEIDFSSLNISAFGGVKYPFSGLDPNTGLVFLSLGDLDDDGNLDDLSEVSPNNYFVISFDFIYSSNCPTSLTDCYNPSANINVIDKRLGVSTDIKYNDQVKSITITPIAKEGTHAVYNYGAQELSSSSMLAPSDVQVQLSEFNVDICPQINEYFKPDNYDWLCTALQVPAIGGAPATTTGYHNLHIDLPLGYSLDLNPGDNLSIPLILPNNPKINCSPPPPTNLITIPFNDITINAGSALPNCIPPSLDINLKRLPSFICQGIRHTYGIGCFQLPLKLNCPNSACMNAFVSSNGGPSYSMDVFKYNVEYVCSEANATNGSCRNANLANASARTMHHCNGGCGVGGLLFGTDDYDLADSHLNFYFKRNTLGWINNLATCQSPNASQLYSSCNLASGIAPPPASLRLDRGYPGDDVEAKVKGNFSGDGSNFYKIFLQIRHKPIDGIPSNSNNLVFKLNPLISSTIKITGFSISSMLDAHGNTVPLNFISPGLYSYDCPVETMEGGLNQTIGMVEMNLLLPRWVINRMTIANLSLASVKYDLEADIHLAIKTEFDKLGNTSFFDNARNPLIDLRTEFMGEKFTGGGETEIEHSCDSWGAQFEILQPNTTRIECAYSPAACEPVNLEMKFTSTGACFGDLEDDFPDEFRPYSSLDGNVIIKLPDSYVFDLGSYPPKFSITQQAYDNTQPNSFGANCTSTIPFLPTDYTLDIQNSELTFKTISSQCWPWLDLKKHTKPPYCAITFGVRALCNAPEFANIGISASFKKNEHQPNPSLNVVSSVSTQPLTPGTQSGFWIHNLNPRIQSSTGSNSSSTASNTNHVESDIYSYCATTGMDALFSYIVMDAETNSFYIPGLILSYRTYQSSNAWITVNGSAISPAIGHNYYKFDLPSLNLNALKCIEFKISGDIINQQCTNTNYALKLYTGTACNAPLMQFSPNSNCNDQTNANFSFYINPSSLVQSISVPVPNTSIAIGGQVSYTAHITNPGLGNILGPKFSIPNLPLGINLISIIFTDGQGNNIFTPGNITSGWDFPNSFLPANVGFTMYDDIIVTMLFERACNYTGAPIVLHAMGKNSCGIDLDIQNSITINANGLPALTVISSSTPSFCANNSVLLSTTSVPVATYQWYLNSNPIQGANNPTYSTTIPGSYSCYVTTNGCEIPSNIITLGDSNPLPDPPNILVNEEIICGSGTGSYSIQNPLGNLTYTWKFDGVVGGTGSSIMHTWTTTGYIVEVIATDNTTGCESLSQATQIVDACCSGTTISNSITIGNNQIPIGATEVLAANVVLTIGFPGTTTTLTDCRIICGLNSSIVVSPGATLELIGCHIQSCDSKWNGIIVNGTSSSTQNIAGIKCYNSFVENAIKAISCNSNSTLDVQNSIFNKNYQDILIDGNSTNNLYSGKINSSVFTSRDIPHPITPNTLYNYSSVLRGSDIQFNIYNYPQIHLGYIPNSIAPYRRGFSGITVKNLGQSTTSSIYTLRIGSINSGEENLFDNMDFGIEVIRSNVEIINNRFQEMEGYDIGQKIKTRGIGIFARNTLSPGSLPSGQFYMKVGGYIGSNSFINCGTGILALDYSNLTIINNQITKTLGANNTSSNYFGKFGINISNSLQSNYICNSNTITNMQTGVNWVQTSNLEQQARFNWNTINTDNLTDKCITAINLTGHPFPDDPVNTSFINIKSNTIRFVENGITADNFEFIGNFVIADNPDIQINTNYNTDQHCIGINNISDLTIENNSNIHSIGGINKNARGILLNDVLRAATVNCNTIYDIGKAVEFDGKCDPVHQNEILNKNTFTNYQIGVNFTPFSNVSSPVVNPQNLQTLPAGDNVYQFQPVSSQIDINNPYPNNVTFLIRNNPPTGYLPITNGNVTLTNVTQNSNVACNSGNSTSSASSNLIGSNTVELIRSLSQGTAIFPVLAQETKWRHSNSIFKLLLNDSTVSTTDTLINDFIDSLQGTNIGNFYIVQEAINNHDWTIAEADNSSISASNHIESNLKTAFTYLIEHKKDTIHRGDSTWLSNTISALTPIATECYNSGGPGVLYARNILSDLTNEVYSDVSNCNYVNECTITLTENTSICDLSKSYSVTPITNAVYTWTVPSGTTYTQSGNSITVNWGTELVTGGTISCLVIDQYGNASMSNYTQSDSLPAPTCITATASNTSCVSATKLNWSQSPCAAGYNLYLGTDGSGTNTPSNLVLHRDLGNVTSYTIPLLLQPNTVHYFKVVPYDYQFQETTGCSIGSFTSGASQALTPTLSIAAALAFEGVTATAIPCGFTLEDENSDSTKWYLSTIAPHSGSNHMRIDNNPDNTTAKSDWFFTPPINVTAGHVYRIDWWARIGSGTLNEDYQVWAGTVPNSATMSGISTNMLGSRVTNSTTYTHETATDYLATSTGQVYFAFKATSLANKGSLYIDDVSILEIQVTQLNSATCNTMLNATNTININAVSGSSNYKLLVSGTGSQSGYYFEHSTNNNNYSWNLLTLCPGVIYGYTYNVAAAFKKNGVWSPYGASCPVTTSAYPQNKLIDNTSTPGYCNDTSGSQNDAYICTSILGANSYEYKIVEDVPGGVYDYNYTWDKTTSNTDFRFEALTNKVRYGYTYDVQVRALVGKTTTAALGNLPGEWGVFGPVCKITLTSAPATSLTPAYCNTTLAAMSDQFLYSAVSGATNYRLRFTSAGGYDVTVPRNNANLDFRMTWIPTAGSPGGPSYNTTYNVQVSASVGGEWTAYGPTCTITTPPAPTTSLVASNCNITLSSMASSVSVVPIGAASMYRLHVTGTGYDNTVYLWNSNTTFYNWTGGMKYGTTYTVTATAFVGSSWLDEGPSCLVTTPAVPQTQLQSSYCPINLSVLSTQLYCTQIPAATNYSFKVTGPFTSGSNQRIYYRNSAVNDFRLSWITPTSSFGAGTYTVEVAFYAGQWESYGTACTIQLASGFSRLIDPSLQQPSGGEISNSSLMLNVYPNPNSFENEFFVQINGVTAKENVHVFIYNMLGDIMYKTDKVIADEGDLIFKPEVSLAKGVYFIETVVNGNQMRKKFVVD